MKGQWAAYQSVHDVASDEQVLANGLIFEVESADGGPPIRLVANPVQFNRAGVAHTRAPEASEHTQLFLMELGLPRDRLHALNTKKAIALGRPGGLASPPPPVGRPGPAHIRTHLTSPHPAPRPLLPP